MDDLTFWIVAITVCLVAILAAACIAYDPRDDD
jgi:hypothetical protein